MATRRVPPFSRCSRSRLLQGLRYCNICNTTALPMREPPAEGEVTDAAQLARQLSGLGYPGFAHLRPRKTNPAAVVLEALLQKDLETRLAEALPWVLLSYPDLDWSWLVRRAKLP